MTRSNQTSYLQYYKTIFFETEYKFHKDCNFDEGIFVYKNLTILLKIYYE